MQLVSFGIQYDAVFFLGWWKFIGTDCREWEMGREDSAGSVDASRLLRCIDGLSIFRQVASNCIYPATLAGNQKNSLQSAALQGTIEIAMSKEVYI